MDIDFLKRFLPGQSPGIVELRRQVSLLNTSANQLLVKTVLITGESGAGKNHLARIIAAHREFMQAAVHGGADQILRQDLEPYLGQFDEVHLPALPNELIESELFGHVRGAFTGATKDKAGLLSDRAEITRTDILLDEIGDASQSLQAKLLQVAETGYFRKVGAEPGQDERTSARIFFATNKSLENEVRNGRFREDLYWRIATFPIHVPPLRSQPENIPAILAQLMSELRSGLPADIDLKPPPSISNEDLSWAQNYEWPGNVRQLRSLLQRWIFEEGAISLKDLCKYPSFIDSSGAIGPTGRALASLENGEDIGSMEQLLSIGADDVRSQVIKWFDQTEPSNEQLKATFSQMQPRSVRQKISDWKRELGKN